MVARSLGLDRTDALAILREIGADTAGALSFGAPSDRRAWAFTPMRDLYDAPDNATALGRHIDGLGRRPLLVGEDGARQSLAGGQKKSALAVAAPDGDRVLRLPEAGDVLTVPRFGAPSTIIVKPDNLSLPGIVENEAYCLHLARAVGIGAVAVTTLAAGERSALCVLPYDRRVAGNGILHRIHQEDFAQANGLPPGRKYEVGTVPGLTLPALLDTGRQHLSPSDTLSLLDQVIFNILVANADGHAKNYSLLLPVAGAPRLAPLYDVSSVLPWEHVNPYFAQKIAGRKRRPGEIAARHWDVLSREAARGTAKPGSCRKTAPRPDTPGNRPTDPRLPAGRAHPQPPPGRAHRPRFRRRRRYRTGAAHRAAPCFRGPHPPARARSCPQPGFPLRGRWAAAVRAA